MKLGIYLAIAATMLGFVALPRGSQPAPPVALDSGLGGTGGRDAGLPVPPSDAGRRD